MQADPYHSALSKLFSTMRPCQSVHLVTSPISPGLLSQLLQCLGCDVLLTIICGAQLQGWGNNSQDPILNLVQREAEESFPFLSLCLKHCCSVIWTSLRCRCWEFPSPWMCSVRLCPCGNTISGSQLICFQDCYICVHPI